MSQFSNYEFPIPDFRSSMDFLSHLPIILTPTWHLFTLRGSDIRTHLEHPVLFQSFRSRRIWTKSAYHKNISFFLSASVPNAARNLNAWSWDFGLFTWNHAVTSTSKFISRISSPFFSQCFWQTTSLHTRFRRYTNIQLSLRPLSFVVTKRLLHTVFRCFDREFFMLLSIHGGSASKNFVSINLLWLFPRLLYPFWISTCHRRQQCPPQQKSLLMGFHGIFHSVDPILMRPKTLS